MRVLTHSFGKPALSAAAVALCAAVGVGGSAAATAPATTGLPGTYAVVKVTISDSAVKLNRKSSRGVNVVAFVIRNTGKKSHAFRIGDTKSQVLKHGQTQDLPVNFDDFGKYTYRVTLHATKKMHGVFTVGR